MSGKNSSIAGIAKRRLNAGLRSTLSDDISDLFIGGTHTRRFQDNLLPVMTQDQIAVLRKQLEAGSGGELTPTKSGKRPAHAPYSSAALALNAFGPWLGYEDRLAVAGLGVFSERLEVEAKLQIANGGGLANLDVLLRGPNLVVGIESKLTEHLGPHKPVPWKPAYRRPEMGALLDESWRELMDFSFSEAWQPSHLDLEQLIKHALALCSHFPSGARHLIYVYWEPIDGDGVPEVETHRREVARCVKLLEGSDPQFHALSYREIWNEWDGSAAKAHLSQLRHRYEVALGDT